MEHVHSEMMNYWHLGSAVELSRACSEATDIVRQDGGDPHTVFIQVHGDGNQPQVAQLHKRWLTDDSNVYDLVIQ